MTRQDAGRNLLFGVIALQLDLIDAGRFAEACSAWAARRDVSLADLLEERGWVTPGDRSEIDRVLRRKLERHDGDACRSLDAAVDRSVGAVASTALGGVEDTDADFAMGAPTEGAPEGGISDSPTVDAVRGVRERFRLVRMFAKGGLGQVWLARDPVLDRDVALKELRPERADDPVFRARFLREARITGRLEHPGIVTVHELADEAKDGRSFYAMKLVRGGTLREAVRDYHDRRDACSGGVLELHDLLDDFVAVCNAVGYAHSRGVIHRDLKGQNIVLGDFGEVVVLDWGLAKTVGKGEGPAAGAASRASDEAGEPLTLPGQQLGTPGFMAPEQAEGRDDLVGVASDVYSLGAILYEILTGRPPFGDSGVTEILRRVSDEDPAPPHQACPGVPRALEAVCLKALSRRPADRYPSAADLARDVKRWLADEPVSVYRDPASERLGRWARRHRPAMMAVVALLIAIAAGSALAVVAVGREQARTRAALASEARHRRQAEANFALAREAVDNLYSKVAENPLLSEPGMGPLRMVLVRTTQEFYGKLVALVPEDPGLKSRLGWSYINLARVTLRAGEVDLANEQLARALAILEGVSAARPGEADPRNDLAHCYLERGDACRDGSRPDEAEDAFERAIALWARLAAETRRPAYDQALGTAYDCLGSLYRSVGRWDRAAEAHGAAARLLRGLAEGDPKGVDRDRVRDRLASCLVGLAGIDLVRGDTARAEAGYREANDTWTALQAVHPKESYRSELAALLGGWSKARAAVGRDAEARAMRERALRMWEALKKEYPESIVYGDNVANEHFRIGEFFEAERHTEEAEAHFRTASSLWGELAPRHPGRPDLKYNRAKALFRLGRLHAEAGHRAEAASDFRTAQALWDGLEGKLREAYAREFRADLERGLKAAAGDPPG